MAEAEFKDHSAAMDTEPSPGTSSVSTTTSSTTTTTITTSSSRMQQPQISVFSGPDRHAVQVIQQALHRPSSSAAQYLQQMYAAQQQHLMLHTAALQQQHLSSSQLQSLAAVQASLSSGRPSTSPTGSVTQQSSMSQTSIYLIDCDQMAAVALKWALALGYSGPATLCNLLLGAPRSIWELSGFSWETWFCLETSRSSASEESASSNRTEGVHSFVDVILRPEVIGFNALKCKGISSIGIE